MQRVALLALVCSMSACAVGRLADPIPTLLYPKHHDRPARGLVVMLPGAGDRLGKYEARGFIDALQTSEMDVDILDVDAHYRYYKSRTLLARMDEDVLAPNRGKYEEIWIVGLSMGGLGALLTASTYPNDIDGVVLIAPYLGRRKLLDEVRAAGGLAKWEPPTAKGEWDLEIWRMLHAGTLPVWLVYGSDDFGAEAHELLAEGLPKERVSTTPGGHDWPTWTKLWSWLMAAQPIAGD